MLFNSDAGHWKILWQLEDTVVELYRLIIEAVANWNTRLRALEDRSRMAKGSVNVPHETADEVRNMNILSRPSLGLIYLLMEPFNF